MLREQLEKLERNTQGLYTLLGFDAQLEQRFVDSLIDNHRGPRLLLLFLPLLPYSLAPWYGPIWFKTPEHLEYFFVIVEYSLIVPSLLLALLVTSSQRFKQYTVEATIGAYLGTAIGMMLMKLSSGHTSYFLPSVLPHVLTAAMVAVGFIPLRRLLPYILIVGVASMWLEQYVDQPAQELRMNLLVMTVMLAVNLITGVSVESSRRRNWLQYEILHLHSSIDPLTGIANRGEFDRALETVMRQATRQQSGLALLLFDIDHFKKLNDTYGHLFGDEILRILGRTLQQFAHRPLDVKARYGGEEFALVLYGVSFETANRIGKELLQTIRQLQIEPPTLGGPAYLSVTVSIGLVHAVPQATTTPKQFIEAADSLLYSAKGMGRDQICAQTLAHWQKHRAAS